MSLLLGLQFAEQLDPLVRGELEQLVATLQTWATKQEGVGKWVNVPYSSSLYSQNAGLWTVTLGNHRQYVYTIVGGNTLHLLVWLTETVTNAAIDHELHIYLPPGLVVDLPDNAYVGDVIWVNNTAGTSGSGIVLVNWKDNMAPDNRRLTLQRDFVGTTWPMSSDFVFFVKATIPIRLD